MTDKTEQLVDALREELKQYGEVMALLEQQQQLVMERNAEGIQAVAERIDQGQRIVDEYNEHSLADEEIRLVVTIKRSIAERTHSARVVIDCSLD